MINKELIKSYINQLSDEQLRKVMFEIIRHYELNDEYNLDTFIDGVVNIVTNSSKLLDRADYLGIIKDNPNLFENEPDKVIADSIEIVGYDNIMNNVKIKYNLKDAKYSYYICIDINKIKKLEKLNNLKSAPL